MFDAVRDTKVERCQVYWDYHTIRADQFSTIHAFTERFSALRNKALEHKLNVPEDEAIYQLIGALDAVMPKWCEDRRTDLQRDSPLKLDDLLNWLRVTARAHGGDQLKAAFNAQEQRLDSQRSDSKKDGHKPDNRKPDSNSNSQCNKGDDKGKGKKVEWIYYTECEKKHPGGAKNYFLAHPKLATEQWRKENAKRVTEFRSRKPNFSAYSEASSFVPSYSPSGFSPVGGTFMASATSSASTPSTFATISPCILQSHTDRPSNIYHFSKIKHFANQKIAVNIPRPITMFTPTFLTPVPNPEEEFAPLPPPTWTKTVEITDLPALEEDLTDYYQIEEPYDHAREMSSAACDFWSGTDDAKRSHVATIFGKEVTRRETKKCARVLQYTRNSMRHILRQIQKYNLIDESKAIESCLYTLVLDDPTPEELTLVDIKASICSLTVAIHETWKEGAYLPPHQSLYYDGRVESEWTLLSTCGLTGYGAWKSRIHRNWAAHRFCNPYNGPNEHWFYPSVKEFYEKCLGVIDTILPTLKEALEDDSLWAPPPPESKMAEWGYDSADELPGNPTEEPTEEPHLNRESEANVTEEPNVDLETQRPRENRSWLTRVTPRLPFASWGDQAFRGLFCNSNFVRNVSTAFMHYTYAVDCEVKQAEEEEQEWTTYNTDELMLGLDVQYNS